MRGRRVEWPWHDRGRSAVTHDSVRDDLARLSSVVGEIMKVARLKDRPTVRIGEGAWL